MLVRVLGTYGYRGRFDEEWNDSMPDPTWKDVEAALRRLDAGEFAGVVLHMDDRRPGEPATEYFSVEGGPGGDIFGYHVGGRHLHYVAPRPLSRARMSGWSSGTKARGSRPAKSATMSNW